MTPSRRQSPLAVFGNRAFTLLWCAQFISTMGGGLTKVAASILVFRATGTAFSVGLMLLVTALPSLVLGLIAGGVVDRVDRKRIMIITELIRAVLALLTPLVLPLGVVWLYAAVLLSSTAAQFFEPAQASILPEVTAEEDLAAANAMITISTFGASAIGFAAAGLIAAHLPIAWAFYLDGLSYLVSAACITWLHIPPHATDVGTTGAGMLRNIRAGMRFVSDTPILRSLLLIFALTFTLFGLLRALLLPFTLRVLGGTSYEYGLLEGVSLIGFVLGSYAMAYLADWLHEGHWLAISFCGMGLALALFSQLQTVELAMIVYAMFYLLNALSYIARQLIIQRHTTRHVRGRVNSTFLMTRDLALMLGMGASGLADRFDVRWLLLADAVPLVAVGLLTLGLPGFRASRGARRHLRNLLQVATRSPRRGTQRSTRVADLAELAIHIPAVDELKGGARQHLLIRTRVYEAPAGTPIVVAGETSDVAYVILDGQAVASRTEAGTVRVLEVLNAGDFFGEIAVLTGRPRTANVDTVEATRLLQIPAAVLREIMQHPTIQRVVVSKLMERILRMNMLSELGVANVEEGLPVEPRTSRQGQAT